MEDIKLLDITRMIEKSEGPKEFRIGEDSTLYFKDQKVISADFEIRERILREAHHTPYTAHLGNMKMYKDLKRYFLWDCMKRDLAENVNKYSVCRVVKVEHQKPTGELQPVPICM